MKPIRYKSLLLSLLAAILVLVNTSRVFGYVNTTYPDSVTMSTAVGTSTTTTIYVLDGRDTMPPNQPKGTIHVYLTGSSEFSLYETDSILQFVAFAGVYVRYSPTSTTPSNATLVIVGDSNTLYVQITGNPLSHFPVDLLTSNGYDSLEANVKLCEPFSVDNKNGDTIHVTNIVLMDDQRPGTQWSLDNVVTLPAAVPPGTSSLGDLCALVSNSDSDANPIYGSLEVAYTYPGGSDSVTVTVRGQRKAVNSDCVMVYNTDFGAVQEGGSRTQSVLIYNSTDSTIYVDSVSVTGDYSEFTINSPSFPLTILSKDSVAVSITFAVPSPSILDNYSAKLSASIYGTSPDGVQCNSLDAGLTGSVLIPIVDSITLDAPPGMETLSITAHTTKSNHAIFIHNSGTNNILLEWLSLTDTSDKYAFFGSQGMETVNMYDTLSVGGTSQPVIMTLEAPDTGTYNLDLSLFYEDQTANRKNVINGAPSYDYKVVAHRLPANVAGVSESLPQVIGFSLNPNPASGEVTISLPQDGNSTIEIYDILGNLMLRKQAASQYIWSGETPGGTAATGSYIVRVTEREPNGMLAVSSKRLIFQR